MSENAACQQLLVDALQASAGGRLLWVADEHPLENTTLHSLAKLQCKVISNRIDQVSKAQAAGVDAVFSDFDLYSPEGKWDAIAFRIAKEKAVVHQVINESLQHLAPRGLLLLSGMKNEGIKTYLSKAGDAMGCSAKMSRGDHRAALGELQLFAKGNPLDDQDYRLLRRRDFDSDDHYWTKPGLYGWQKIDKGSAFLLETLNASGRVDGKSVLDLGCGFGYLAMNAAKMGASRLLAVDNCAAAIHACQQNLDSQPWCLDWDCQASDCANEISEKFDLVLCNPPFHEGFAMATSLHSAFFQSIARRLAAEGQAWVVVNQFLRLDAHLEAAHLETVQRWNNGSNQFTLYQLRKSRT